MNQRKRAATGKTIIPIVFDATEKVRMRQLADERKWSLSQWIREAAREKVRRCDSAPQDAA